MNESESSSSSSSGDKEGDGDNPCGNGENVDSLSNASVGDRESYGKNEGSLELPLLTQSQSPQTKESELESESEWTSSADNHGDRDSAPNKRGSGVWRELLDDFDTSRGGDRKILRAIGRTATVNAIVAATAPLGPIAAVAGYATGGAITAKRLVGDGIVGDNPKEVAKSLAVFGSATSASLAGQAIAGAVAIGVLGASLPVAGAVAFGAGCVSGITAGALSEWGVDGVMAPEAATDTDDSEKEAPCRTAGDNTEFVETSPPGGELLPRKSNLVDACGAWVNRQRERNRRRRFEREKARKIEKLSRVSWETQTTCADDSEALTVEESMEPHRPKSDARNSFQITKVL
jgi:hypothetical protein